MKSRFALSVVGVFLASCAPPDRPEVGHLSQALGPSLVGETGGGSRRQTSARAV